MKRKHFLLATAALVMAGCANEDFVGENVQNPLSGEQAIGFNMNMPTMTRGTSGDATTLHSLFYVWGEKNENGGTEVKEVDGNIVFNNNKVTYNGESSKNTTTSNTEGWDYVGQSMSANEAANFTTNIGAGKAQTIKYWDDNANSYTFTAVSALKDQIESGVVKISKIVKGTDEYAKGYTVTLGSGATTGAIYYADRVNIPKNGAYTHDAVTLNFRNFESKVRFGIYEKVPGYKVVITGLKYETDENTPSPTTVEHKSKGETFAVTGNFVLADAKTQYTVTYEDGTNSSTKNKAKVTVGNDAKTQTYKDTEGKNWLNTSWTSTTVNTCIGTEANNPTWDKGTTTTDSWTTILPNPGNQKNLKLIIKYDLYSEDSGEKISVDYKTVEVPCQYCQWKPNFAYTYLFKISDKSTELYPITFDAVVETDELGNQETITTVSDLSWTTFATTSTTSGATTTTTYVTEENEYKDGDAIYATLYNGSSIVNLDADNVKLYIVTTTNSDKYPITEASVADALNKIATNKATLTTLNVKPDATNAPSVTYKTEVPTEDGGTVSLNGGAAMTWEADGSETVYAVVYTDKTDKTIKAYKVIKLQK